MLIAGCGLFYSDQEYVGHVYLKEVCSIAQDIRFALMVEPNLFKVNALYVSYKNRVLDLVALMHSLYLHFIAQVLQIDFKIVLVDGHGYIGEEYAMRVNRLVADGDSRHFRILLLLLVVVDCSMRTR